MSGDVAADRVRAAVERRPVLRASLQLPYVFVVLHGLASARGIRPLVATVLIAASVVAVIGVTRESRREPSARSGRDLAGSRWRVASAFVGTAMLAPALVVAVDVHVPAFSVAVALILLTMGFLLGPRLRLAAGTWTLAVWAVTLWWSGVRSAIDLLALVGASAAVFVAAIITSGTLARAANGEARARLEADGSTRLLESQLGARSLDVDGVAGAAARSLRHRGFDAVVVRLLDRRLRLARPIATSGRHADARERSIDDPPIATVVATAATHRQARRDGRVVLHLPLFEQRVVIGVIEATMRRGSDEADLTAAARSLAGRAERALGRARAFERDERDREELAWLEQRSNDLVSTVSHELRTPMTVIAGLGDTLQARWTELDPTVRATLLDRIGANAERLAAIVGSLIDSGALEDGQLRADPRVVALRPLIDGVLDRLELLTASHVVRTRIAGDLEVVVDAALLEHVVENLLVNVAHHTPPGTTVTVDAVTDVDGGRVAVAVVDDGPGIRPDEVEHVFERFFRGGDPDRRSSGGLGLGLPLARQIVRAHGGDLVVERVGEDGGTRFRFTVEAVPADRDPSTGRSGRQPTPSPPRTAVVDGHEG